MLYLLFSLNLFEAGLEGGVVERWVDWRGGETAARRAPASCKRYRLGCGGAANPDVGLRLLRSHTGNRSDQVVEAGSATSKL